MTVFTTDTENSLGMATPILLCWNQQGLRRCVLGGWLESVAGLPEALRVQRFFSFNTRLWCLVRRLTLMGSLL